MIVQHVQQNIWRYQVFAEFREFLDNKGNFLVAEVFQHGVEVLAADEWGRQAEDLRVALRKSLFSKEIKTLKNDTDKLNHLQGFGQY